jgi:mercuric ion transport protein
MKSRWRTSLLTAGGLLPAILASTCCIGPLLAIAGTMGVSAGSLSALSSLKPYLVSISVLMLGTGLFLALRKRKSCNCGSDGEGSENGSPLKRLGGIGFWTSAAALFTALLLFWPHLVPGSTSTSKPAGATSGPASHLSQSVFQLEDFDQECCVGLVLHALKPVSGYERAEADLKARTLTVWYSPDQTDATKLMAAIDSSGYKATLIQK